MSITDAQYVAWLGDPTAQRVTLYDLGCYSSGAQITRRVSNRPYSDSSVDPYLCYVMGGLKTTHSISLESEATVSYGDIEIMNLDGSLDSWLNDRWVNQSVTVRLGDARWPISDFRTEFVGVIADIDGTKSRDRLNILIRDNMQDLNTPLTEEQMGGSAPDPKTLRPYVFGEVHNIEPKLKNPTTKEYEFCAVASEDVIEVRTDGKPRTAITKNLSLGSFTFTEAVGPGAVTCSIQGVKPSGTYTNKIGPLIQYIVTSLGKASTRLTTGDIDAASFSTFAAANTQTVGLFVSDRRNVLEVCRDLAASVGAQIVQSRAGLLQIIQFAIPTVASYDILPNDQLDRSIKLVAQTKVRGAIRINYCKNYTVQEVQTGIPLAHKELFKKEWLEETVKDDTVLADYKLDNAPEAIETCLQKKTEAVTEATRRLNLFKVKRLTYRYDGTSGNLALTLGQAVTLYSNRYGLSAGKVGIVSSLTRDLGTYRVTVEVTV